MSLPPFLPSDFKISFGTVLTLITLIGGGITTIQKLTDSGAALESRLSAMESNLKDFRVEVHNQISEVQTDFRSNVSRLDTQDSRLNAKVDDLASRNASAPAIR